MTAFLDELIKRAKDHDAARPRSTQAAVGWSEVGGCRSAVGYRLEGAWASDETDTWAAQRGTAIHEYLEGIITGPGVLTEVDTEYRGIPGHADVVTADTCWDFKTTSLASSRLWQSDQSLLRQKRIQVHGYTAGLIDAGILPPDARAGLLVVPVDGQFADWWAYEEPFDRALADEGADRLEAVRAMLAEGSPRPKDMPFAWCEAWCQFFSICRTRSDAAAEEVITDPELAAAVAAYGEAHQRWSAADKEKKGLANIIRGLNGVAGEWRVSLGKPGDDKEVLDEVRIRAEYEASGRPLPLTVKAGAAARLSVTRVKSGAKP